MILSEFQRASIRFFPQSLYANRIKLALEILHIRRELDKMFKEKIDKLWTTIKKLTKTADPIDTNKGE